MIKIYIKDNWVYREEYNNGISRVECYHFTNIKAGMILDEQKRIFLKDLITL